MKCDLIFLLSNYILCLAYSLQPRLYSSNIEQPIPHEFHLPNKRKGSAPLVRLDANHIATDVQKINRKKRVQEIGYLNILDKGQQGLIAILK